MILLALNQSTRKVCYSIYEDEKLVQFGSFEPTVSYSTDKRIYEICRWFKKVVKAISKIDLVLLKDVQLQTRINGSNNFFSNQDNNVLTFKVLSQLQGALINTCHNLNIKFKIISPHWKSIVGIKSSMRNSQRAEAMELVENIFGEYAEEDEADSICMGYSYIIENKKT